MFYSNKFTASNNIRHQEKISLLTKILINFIKNEINCFFSQKVK